MRALKAFAGLVLVLFVATGCLVETEATLGDADPKNIDTRLLGNWYYAEKDEVSLMSIAADPSQEGAYRVMFTNVTPLGDKPPQFVQYSVTRTIVNGQPYLNVRRIGGNSIEQPVLTILAYDIGADGKLVLRLMKTKLVIDAIKAGKLKGTVKENQYSSEAKITSPRAELAAFIAAANRDELFSDTAAALRRLPETPN
jgi:hypothetical protein